MTVGELVARAVDGVSTREKLIAAFDARIDAIDFEDAKRDVLPYLKDSSELDIWSRAFFKEYVRKIVIAPNVV